MANPGLLKKAVKLTEKGFRIKNKLLMPYTSRRGDATLYILKNDATSSRKFVVLAEFQNFGMDTERSEFGEREYFEIAKSEKTFGANGDQHLGEILRKASHVALKPNGEIFSCRINGETQVKMTDFTYKIYGELTGQTFDKERDA